MNEAKLISKIIIDSTKIPLLVGALLSYFIGGGFVSYIGKNIDWLIFWLGLGITLLFLLTSQYLSIIFRLNSQFNNFDFRFRLKIKNTFLQLGLTTLSVGALSTIFLFYSVQATMVIWFFLTILFIFNVILIIPPFNLRNRGYGDLINALNLAVFIPAFAQSLQISNLHRSLIMITFPGLFLLLSFFLVFSFENYGFDLRNSRLTLLTLIGWKTGMNFHNIFLLLTYFSYSIVALFSLSFNLLIPAIAAFPFSILQFWEMLRIGNGAKPRWKVLYLSAGASIGIFVYFLLLNLWFR